MQSDKLVREFAFRHQDFKELAAIVYNKSGITLGDHKKDMVYGRLSRRLRELKFNSFADYLAFVRNDSNDSELEHLINAVTTNLTRFFRENHHFKHVETVVIPELLAANTQKIRFWSAACASGPEPYSLAMTTHNALETHPVSDLKILATDLDTKMLQTARAGIYEMSAKSDIPTHMANKYLTVSTEDDQKFRINKNIRQLISFNQMNLMNEWPMKGQFDVIFCRNVLIYFNAEDKHRITMQLISKLKIGGYLYMGHAESILNPPPTIKSVGTTTYQRRQ